MNRRGFTVVELLITMTILVILLTLGVVSMRGVQANARDAERQSDIDTIVRGLEQRYKYGNSREALPLPSAEWPDSARKGAGTYPGVNEIIHTLGTPRGNFEPTLVPGGYLGENLPGVSTSAITSPSGKQLYVVCNWACAPAGDATQLNNAFNTQGDNYLYEPVQPNGNTCANGNCSSYNLYWKSEVDGQIKKVTSRHK